MFDTGGLLFRRLFYVPTFLSALLLPCLLALWARSAPGRYEAFLLRTAPAYATGPRLKGVLLDTRDGLHVTCLVKVVPLVPPRAGTPWRRDVRVGATGASAELPGRPVAVHSLLAPLPAWRSSARAPTDAERRDYESAAEPDYAATPWVSREPNGPAFRGVRPSGPPWLQRVGVWSYGPDDHLVDDERLPGAYRRLTVRLPFALPAALAAIPPLATLPRALRWGRARRRLRARLCPACAYDLRSSPGRCPECGRPVVQAETDRACQPIPRLVLARTLQAPRATLIGHGAAAACLVAAVLAVRHATAAIPTAETRRLHHELEAQLATVSRRADRLRAAGHAPAAAQLDEGLRAARRVAAGGPPEPRDGPALDVVSCSEFHPGGMSFCAAPATVEVTATDRPLVLALCAAESFTWRLKVAPRARLEKVLLEGYRRQRVLDVPPGVKVEDHTHDAGNWHEYVTPTDDTNPDERRLNEALLRQRTGLRVRTWQARSTGEGRPFVVGPESPAWSLRCALHALRPAYLTAARQERDAAEAAVRSIRFTAPFLHVDPPPDALSIRRPSPWRGRGDYRPTPRTYWCTARYDARGPIESTIRRVPDGEGPPAFGAPVPFDKFPRDNELDVFDPARGRFVRIPLPCDRVPRTLRTGPVALDPRRRRLMVADFETGRLHAYDLDSGTLDSRQPLGDGPGRRAITYSPRDDCFYVVAPALGAHGQHVMTLTRLDPDGQPQWQIPLAESIGGTSYPGDVYAVDDRIVLLTGPLRDPLDPDAPPRRRCVVLDPATNTTLYSGPIAPHAGDAGPP